MNLYLRNSIKNLLFRSIEKEEFKIALKEWSFTGEIIDHFEPIETCNLCEKAGLRYHFEIKNSLNNSIWVGSNCIEKFDILIFDEFGNEITNNKDRYLQKQAKKKHIKGVFEKLGNTNPIGKIKGKNQKEWNKKELDVYCINTFNKMEKLDPKMLNYLFIRFEEESINFDKGLFSTTLNSLENKDQLINMSRVQFDRIKKALSLSQRKYYEENKKSS